MRSAYPDNKIPGPGNYESDGIKIMNKDPSWSLSKTPRDSLSKSSVVGPGAYDSDKNYKDLVSTNKGYNFGSESKLKYSPNKVPGPG